MKLLAIVILLSLARLASGQTDAMQPARAAVSDRRYDDAMSVYESVLAAGNPTSQAAKSGEIEAATGAALALRSQGQMEEALSHLLRAKKAVGADPSLLFDVGILENQMHLNHDADEALHQSLSLRPDDPLTMYAIARVKMDLGLYPDAEEAMRAYLQKRPDDASAHYGLGRILVINLKDDTALEEFQRSIALKPAQTESYYEIGEIALRANDLDTAEKNYQICLKRDPHHGGALTGMGIIKYRAKQYQQAADYLERAVRFAPKFKPLTTTTDWPCLNLAVKRKRRLNSPWQPKWLRKRTLASATACGWRRNNEAIPAPPEPALARLGRKLPPFLREVLVGKGFDEYSSNDRPGLKADHLPGLGVVPIRQGHAGERLVDPLADRIHEHLKVARVTGERSRPELPIEFGVICAIIERQSVQVQVL